MLEVFEIKYFLDLGISLTEQGIGFLDYDQVQILKQITTAEARKMEEDNNNNINQRGVR